MKCRVPGRTTIKLSLRLSLSLNLRMSLGELLHNEVQVAHLAHRGLAVLLQPLVRLALLGGKPGGRNQAVKYRKILGCWMAIRMIFRTELLS